MTDYPLPLAMQCVQLVRLCFFATGLETIPEMVSQKDGGKPNSHGLEKYGKEIAPKPDFIGWKTTNWKDQHFSYW